MGFFVIDLSAFAAELHMDPAHAMVHAGMVSETVNLLAFVPLRSSPGLGNHTQNSSFERSKSQGAEHGTVAY